MWFSKQQFNQNGFDVDISITSEDSNPPPSNIEFDSEEDKDKFVKEVYRRLEEGDLWAWCFVKVEVKYMGFIGSTTLSEVSAANLEDFKENSGYYGDLLNEARTDCLKNIQFAIENGNEAKLAQESFPEI